MHDCAPYAPQPINALKQRWTSVRDERTWPRRHYVLCMAYENGQFHTIASGCGRPDWTMSEIDAFHNVIYAQPERTSAAIEDALGSMGLATPS